jgi:hypothetical protein
MDANLYLKPMKKRILSTMLSGLLVAALDGCSSTPVKLPVPFDQKEAAALLVPGTNQISGTILYEQDKGRVLAFPDTFVSCAGREVALIPYTDFAREWALRYYGKPVTDIAYRLANRGRSIQVEGQEQMFEVSRKTRCDDKGNFSFSNVANGDFLLMAHVQWLGKDEASYQFGFAPEDIDEEDGSVIKRIRLEGNDKINLTGPWP